MSDDAERIAEVIAELWDEGNAAGLDGWIGPGRGAGEVDDEALYQRARAVEKYSEALAAAGIGHVPTALHQTADAARGMHHPPAPVCVEWADWLDTRAAQIGDTRSSDEEHFCSRCFAGVDSDEHHGKCVVAGHAEDGESA